MRRILFVLFGAVALLAGVTASLLIYAATADIAPLAQRFSRALFGRPAQFASLRMDVGRSLRFSAQGLRLPAAIDPSLPDLAQADRAEVSIRLFPLFVGRLVFQSVMIDGLRTTLARDADGTGNWATSRDAAAKRADAGKRIVLPPLLNIVARDATIIYAAGAQKPFTVHIEALQSHTPGPANPVELGAKGQAGGTPVTLKAALASFNELQDLAKPFKGSLLVSSGANTLRFDGTATDPLKLDGLAGRLEIDVPGLSQTDGLAKAGVPTGISLSAAGVLQARDSQWRLQGVHGTLQGATFQGQVDYDGDGRGKAGKLTASAQFGTIDAGSILKADTGGGPATLPTVPNDPGILLDVRVRAQSTTYGAVSLDDLAAHFVTQPGKARLEQAAFGFAGGRVSGSATAEPGGGGTRITGTIDVAGVETGQAYRAAGSQSPPLQGAASGRAAFDLVGGTMQDALGHGRIAGALSMTGGTISRKLLRMAKANVRALWTDGGEMTQLRCALAAADVRDGIGRLDPVQVQTAAGTLAAWGQADLLRRTLDVTLQSEDRTTDGIALDVPISVSGAMTDPEIMPSPGSSDSPAHSKTAGPWPPGVGNLIDGSGCKPS